MKVYDTEAQWLAAREGRFGASTVPAIMGVSPWTTPLKLFHQIKGDIPAPAESFPMKLGKRIEPVIDLLYCEQTERVTADLGDYTIQENSRVPFLSCTLDRLIVPCDGHDAPGGLQMKMVTAYKTDEWNGKPPVHVEVQVQAEMAVTGLTWTSIAALLGNQRLAVYDVERHEDFIKSMLVKVSQFKQRLIDDDPPAAMAADMELLNELHPSEESGKVITAPEGAVEIDEALTDLEAQVKAANGEIKAHKAALKGLAGDAEKLIIPGRAAWTWKTVERKEHVVAASSTRVFRRSKG